MTPTCPDCGSALEWATSKTGGRYLVDTRPRPPHKAVCKKRKPKSARDQAAQLLVDMGYTRQQAVIWLRHAEGEDAYTLALNAVRRKGADG